MNFYLLDAAAGGLILGFLVVFMLLAVTIEAITMIILKYNKAGKSFLDSFIVNVVSLIAGLLLENFSDYGIDIVENEYLNLFILFLITVVIEFAFLFLLNRKKPVGKTFLTAVLINVVSYLLLIGITFIFSNVW